MHHFTSLRRFVPATFASACLGLAAQGLAQDTTHPRLLLPVDPVPAQATAWDARERASSPMIARSRFVRVDTAALQAIRVVGPAPLATFQLDLFEDAVVVDIGRIQWVLHCQVFTGSVRGQQGQVLLSVGPDGRVSGSVHLPARTFAVAYAAHADVHALQEIDQSRLPAHMGCGVNASHEVAAPGGPGAPDAGPNSDCGKTILDVLVFYTPRARTNAGGTSAMETAIVGGIAQANAGNDASGVPMEFRLVHMAETNYVETGGSNDLSRFRSSTDGIMDEVHGLRTTYGGDLMHLITDPATPQYCGIAYLMTSLSTGFASSAFAVSVRTCIPGHTFTHEMGHNIGCNHDRANAGATAVFPYAYGYRTPDNAFRTIMAYAPGTRVNVWSSPVTQYQGYTMGVAGSEDNALSITGTRTTASQFRATVAPVWCDLSGGIPGTLGLPTLTGRGTINGAQPLTLTIRNYRPNASGFLVVGASAINLPMFGGTLVPSWDVALFVTGNGANIVHDAGWLANLAPGFQVWFQAAFFDPMAVQGVSASDGVRVSVP